MGNPLEYKGRPLYYFPGFAELKVSLILNVPYIRNVPCIKDLHQIRCPLYYFGGFSSILGVPYIIFWFFPETVKKVAVSRTLSSWFFRLQSVPYIWMSLILCVRFGCPLY